MGRHDPRNVGPDGKHKPSQSAGRKGAQHMIHPWVVASADEAIPARPGSKFGATDAQWATFVPVFAATGGRILPAAMAAGLNPRHVEAWFHRAVEGREPWRSKVELATIALGNAAGVFSQTFGRSDPGVWLHRAFPDDFAHPRQVVDLNATGMSADELLRRALAMQAGTDVGDTADKEDEA